MVAVGINEDRASIAIRHGHIVEHGPVDGLLGTNNDNDQDNGANDHDGGNHTTRDSTSESSDVETARERAVGAVEAAKTQAASDVGVGVGDTNAIVITAIVGARGSCHGDRQAAEPVRSGQIGAGAFERINAGFCLTRGAAPAAGEGVLRVKETRAARAGELPAARLASSLLTGVTVDSLGAGALAIAGVASASAVAHPQHSGRARRAGGRGRARWRRRSGDNSGEADGVADALTVTADAGETGVTAQGAIRLIADLRLHAAVAVEQRAGGALY